MLADHAILKEIGPMSSHTKTGKISRNETAVIIGKIIEQHT